jgi:hypothetical protein
MPCLINGQQRILLASELQAPGWRRRQQRRRGQGHADGGALTAPCLSVPTYDRSFLLAANVCSICARGCAVSRRTRLMLDPTFRARAAHIVQFRSIGTERITDSPPQLLHRSRQFTAHDTLPYPVIQPLQKGRSDQQIAGAQSAFAEHRSVICADFQQASCYCAPKCCRRMPTSASNILIARSLSAEIGVLVWR